MSISGLGFARLTGTLLVPIAVNVGADQFDIAGGVANGPGTLTVNNELRFSGITTMTLDNQMTLINGAAASWMGSADLNLNRGSTIENAGTFEINVDGLVDSTISPRGQFNNSGMLVKKNSLARRTFSESL